MKKNGSHHRSSVPAKQQKEQQNASLRSLFRERYGCYAGNRSVLTALVEHQLGPKFSLAVQAHVWNCEACRKACDGLKRVSAANRQAAEVTRQLYDSLPPVERLLVAIKDGAHSYDELSRETKLAGNDLIDALSRLLFQHREVRTVMVNRARVYFIDQSMAHTDCEQLSKTELPTLTHPRQLLHDQKELANRIAEGVCRRRRTG